MPDELIHLEVSNGVCIGTLDNPPMNVMTLELMRALSGVVTHARDDAEIRVLVVTSAGDRAFNAGSDIRELPAMLSAGDIIRRKIAFENETLSDVESLPIPTIAALNGIAYGGGLELALACDFIIAERGQTVGLPEIKLGLFPGAGGAVRATRRIGEARAKQLIFLGEPLDTEIALQWGLIDWLVDRGAAVKRARELGAQLAARPAASLRLAKQAIALRRDRTDEVAMNDSVRLFEEVCGSRDAAEGVNAFIEKRTARFTHA